MLTATPRRDDFGQTFPLSRHCRDCVTTCWQQVHMDTRAGAGLATEWRSVCASKSALTSAAHLIMVRNAGAAMLAESGHRSPQLRAGGLRVAFLDYRQHGRPPRAAGRAQSERVQEHAGSAARMAAWHQRRQQLVHQVVARTSAVAEVMPRPCMGGATSPVTLQHHACGRAARCPMQIMHACAASNDYISADGTCAQLGGGGPHSLMLRPARDALDRSPS